MSDNTLSALFSAALVGTGAPLERATGLPGRMYTDPAVFGLERDALFHRRWLFVGRAEALDQSGAYRAVDTAGGPVVLVRGDDGVLRAFANVCRHRGSILLEGAGTCRRIVCPYHGWSYRTDGTLAHAPDMEGAADFDPSDNGLVAVRLADWAGFHFVCFDAATPPLMHCLGDLPDRLASHDPASMRHVWTLTLECACNWKLILENAMETYHTGLVHRDSVGTQTSRDVETQGDWLCIQVLSGRSIATLPDAPPSFDPVATLDAEARKGTYFTIALPACQFAVAQDCLWWLNVIPRAADRTILEIGGCFPEAATNLSDFDERAKPYLERWEAVGREDVGILERQQRALESPLYRPGRLSHRDAMVRTFDLWVVNRLRGHLT